jgi:chromosome segregation ATPase
MSDDTVDMLAGLSVVENELERALDELDDMYGRLNIHLLEWVSLWPLKWALGKLADDLHKVDTELRSARLDVTSARVDASEARAAQRSEQMQSLSVVNELRAELETVKAERDSLRQENDWLRQSKDAAIIEMDKARDRLAEIDRAVAEAMQAPTNAETLRRVQRLEDDIDRSRWQRAGE